MMLEHCGTKPWAGQKLWKIVYVKPKRFCLCSCYSVFGRREVVQYELLGDIAKGYQMSEMCREMRIIFCLLQINHHSLKKAGCETIIKNLIHFHVSHDCKWGSVLTKHLSQHLFGLNLADEHPPDISRQENAHKFMTHLTTLSSSNCFCKFNH